MKSLVLLGPSAAAEHGVEVEPAVVDDDEVGLGLVPGPVRADPQPADGQVAAAPAADLLVEDSRSNEYDRLVRSSRGG